LGPCAKRIDSFIENNYRSYVDTKGKRRQNTPPQGVGGAIPQRVSSQSLLGPRRELVIEHNGREYHLRLTQNGKLILTA
jgi:hemin uptake protein HemP